MMNTICTGYCISLFLVITFQLSTQEISDTITASQMLRDNGTTLVSSGGIFELGFFSSANSSNRYVGIWYKNITARTVVWVANRDDPLTDTSGTLKVVGPGSLVLVNGTNGVVWSTNASSNVQNPVARLLDSGNLVVKDDNMENFVWQSFDYPTDTLLPGMKFGWNFRTGREVYLASWKKNGDPGRGDYTCHFGPTDHPQLVIRKGTNVVARTGPWNGVSFGWNPKYRKNGIFTYQVVINMNEVYYVDEQQDESTLTRFTVTESGVGQRWIWNDRKRDWIMYVALPIDNCDTFNTCGPYSICNIENTPPCGCLNKFEPKEAEGWDTGDGCIRRTPLNCQKGDDVFLKYSDIKLPDTQHSWSDDSMTLEECKVLCSKNCSCTAYASLDISRGENGCLLWFGELLDIRKISPSQDIHIRMAASEEDRKGKKREILVVVLSLAVGILLVGLSMLLYSQKRRKLLDYHHPDESHKDIELPLFGLSIITKATDNFSSNNKLGEGGFGPVYKGLLEDGTEVAVKCLSRNSHPGVEEFKNEIICIAKLQHRNLVKLLGWCIQSEEMMLVYEYMANKSLDLILFDPTKSMLLNWPTRFNIINGIARGLMYLHQDSRLRVIHRDLKASNILLDSDMNPKISDFGLARTFGGNETGADTTRIVGTYGYMSPEYAVDGIFSVKSDVFSYGVIVLEIVSGKKNRGFSHKDHPLNLLGHAWMLYREERSMEMVDSCMRNSCYLSEALRSIHIGLLCVQERPEDRPNMSSVVLMLSNEGVLPEAKHPGFFTARDVLVKNETSVSSNTESSKNTISITQLEAP